MWYVEGRFGDQYERWEGLTQEQSQSVHADMYRRGSSMTRSGRMQ